jgi:hypothetical protein
MKKAIVGLLAALLLAGCTTEADTVSENLSKEADSFNVERRVVFFNGITDKYLLTIEGRCSLGNNDDERSLTVTCRTGEGEYKKHFLGLSDNVSFFVEQTDAENVDPYHYKVIFRPEAIVPDIDLQTSKD